MTVLHLPEARVLYPDKPLFGWERKSSDSQAGKKREKLIQSANELSAKLEEIAPGQFVETFYAVEKAKLSTPRKRFRKAIEAAKERNAMLVTWSMSRFLRPEAFDYRVNLHAVPTESEMKKLAEMTEGVVLATILPPDATESDRRSEAIKRHGNAGQGSKAWKNAWKVFTLLGRRVDGQWERSLREVAARCGCSKDSIARLLRRPVPAELVDTEGATWGDLPCPIESLRKMNL